MERAEAEAIYDAGRDACVEFLVELSARYERQIARLEARVAEERVDRLVEHWPERCSGCDHRFGEERRTIAAPPHRHQVWELPQIAVAIEEHRAHRVRCPRCSAETRALLPAGVAASAFGPRLRAAVAMLSVRNRVSRRDASELLEELFGCPISPGSVDAICQRTSGALAAPYGELREAVKDAPVVCVDETGWRQAGERRTLWGALTDRHAAFHVAADRHQRELPELIGERFAGIVCSDRWWAYDQLDPARRQVCWAHLLRDFRRHSEGLSHQQRFGEQGLEICRRLFAAWARFDQHADRDRLAREIAPLQRKLRALLERAATKHAKNRHIRTFARNLLTLWPALWTFTEIDGVEPTNNRAERGLRAAVIYRKVSLGSQSDAGARFAERMLSVSHTCRLQRRSLFAYLIDAIGAPARASPAPSLA